DTENLINRLEKLKSKIPDDKKPKVIDPEDAAAPKGPVRQASTPIDTKAIEDAKKKAEEARKKYEEEVKKSLDLAKSLTDERIKMANLELQQYILNNASRLANEKVLTKALVDEEKARLDEIAKKRQAILDQELAQKNSALEREVESQKKKNETLTGIELENGLKILELKQEQLNTLAVEYYNKDLQLKQETDKAKLDAEKLYGDQLNESKKLAQSLEYQQRLLDLETQGATEFEIRSEQLTQQYEMEAQKYLEDIYNKFNLKVEADAENLTIQQEIDAAQAELAEQIANSKDLNEKTRLQNHLTQLNQLEQSAANQKVQITKMAEQQKLDAISGMLSNAKTLFGEHTVAFKAIAIAQATIDTYKSAVAAYAAGLSVGGPAGLVLGPVSAGLAVAAGVANIAKIAGVKFSKGGIPVGPSHAEGGIPAMVANKFPIEMEGGEAIINKKSTAKFKGLLSAINQDQGGVSFGLGGIPGISSVAGVKELTSKAFDMNTLATSVGNAVEAGSARGTEFGSQKGISDLSSNNQIENNANF
ncbi:MAG: hypothetical protein ACRCU6_04030, partial [Fusobacteriaceae bacterium]